MNEEDLDDLRYRLLFDVRRSVRYHLRRRSFFERFHTTSTALALVLGSGAIYAGLSGLNEKLLLIAGVIVTTFSYLDIALSSISKSRLHTDLARQFIELERQMVVAGDFDEEHYREYTSRRLQIEMEEPPVLRVLDVICYNETLRALGHDTSELAPITTAQRLLAPFFDWRSDTLRVPEVKSPS